MKRLVILSITGLLIFACATATAGRYRHHGFHGHGFRHHTFHGHHHGSAAGYFFGGLALGTLFAPPPRYVAPPVVYVPPPVTVTPAPTSAPARAMVSRRLLRDINGQCFERKVDAAGTELRIELPASECAW